MSNYKEDISAYTARRKLRSEINMIDILKRRKSKRKRGRDGGMQGWVGKRGEVKRLGDGDLKYSDPRRTDGKGA